MDKTMIMEAYYRGLLSQEECSKILGIDQKILAEYPENHKSRIERK